MEINFKYNTVFAIAALQTSINEIANDCYGVSW